MDLYLAHFLILIWAGLGTARRLVTSLADQLLIAGLLTWGNLVVTGLFLSALHKLGQPAWFLEVSAGLAVLLCLTVLRWVRPETTDNPPGISAPARPSGWLVSAFIVTLAPLAYATLVAAYIYEPNNSDSLAYQLPRTLYYLGQGSLAHFEAADPRQVQLPFNYNLVQLGDFIYGAPLQCLDFFNVVAWGLAGIAVYRLCRLCALSANASFITCWLAIIAPPVMAQAASTTLELPVGAALMGASVFVLRWKQHRLARDAALAALAVGVAAGADLRAWLIAVGAGLFLLVRAYGRRQTSNETRIRAWIVPGLLACALGLPFIFLNLAAHDGRFRSLGTLAAPASGAWTVFRTVWQKPVILAGLNEDVVGFGLTGVVFTAAAIFALIRPRRVARPVAWLAGCGLVWILLSLIFRGGAFPSPRDLTPALLAFCPAIAALIQGGPATPPARRIMANVSVAVVALAAIWSGGLYLLYNTSRPFAPLFNGTFVPPALPPLPSLLDFNLSRAAWINVDTDGTNERIFPLLALRRMQRITSRHAVEPSAYNLFSRSSLSRNAGAGELALRPSYAVLPFPGKQTGGVQFLATVGRGANARDYFGLEPQAGDTPATSVNQFLLITLSEVPRSRGAEVEMHLKIDGLNLNDHARIVLDAENENGNATELAAYRAGESQALTVPPAFGRLVFRILDVATDGEISRVAVPYHAAPNGNPAPLDPGLPTSDQSLFVSDLVLSDENKVVASDGLTPTEGPFPQWDLPYVRWARQPVVKLTLPPTPKLARVQLTFSLRLHVRPKGALEVLFNGRVVDYQRLHGSATWLDRTLELTPQPGENIVEFRDAPLKKEPDWMEYLERYPDVKRFLIAHNLPLEEGARQHYESSGRPEGRTVVLDDAPVPAANSYYFMFRTLRVEGFKSP